MREKQKHKKIQKKKFFCQKKKIFTKLLTFKGSWYDWILKNRLFKIPKTIKNYQIPIFTLSLSLSLSLTPT